jgi:fructose-1,6-bisphosphatase/inositol monophosphatase family enzyme
MRFSPDETASAEHQGHPRLGSAALDICWVAMGRLQGFYEGS